MTCWQSKLTIDRNKQRVYLSFTRSQDADKALPSVCGKLPRTQVLMNCTGWPRIRKEAKHRRVTVISVALATSARRLTMPAPDKG